MTRGEEAERRVIGRLRDAVTDGSAIYENVRWTSPVRRSGPARDGEADIVIAHPDRGVLVVEVKSGAPSRDQEGRWHIGGHMLAVSPFEQASTSAHVLHDKLVDLPDWPVDLDPMVGHAVAFPDVDLASLPRGHVLLGLDEPTDIVLDATAVETDEGARSWLDGAFAYWTGDGAGRKRPPGSKGMILLDELLRPTVSLRRLVRGRIADDRVELIAASSAQARIMNTARSMRRLEIVGPAGSGKSLLAAEKARALAAEGYRTLLVCFNQRLATTMGRELEDARAPAGLTVTTFHRLCERLGTDAGVLPSRPSPIPQDWWDETLPRALDAAIDADPDTRFHAIIIDEGQDFVRGWLESLELLLIDRDDVFWVFHDPAQALRQPDVVGELDLPRFELFEDHRNPPDVARLANRFRPDGSKVDSLRTAGLPVRIVEAEPGHDTVDAVRRALHELLVDEQVPPFEIAVLSGRSAPKSDVWKHKRFGNAVLWNAAIDDAGESLGLAPEDVPDEPTDVVLYESIRRFKGLEREVIVLIELPEEGERFGELLYVGLTRATTQLVVIAPPALARRFRGP